MSNATRVRQFRKVLFATSLVIFMSPASLFAADPKIDLKIVDNGGKFKIVFENSECPSDPALLGCINVAKGSKNWLQWEVKQGDWQNGWDLSDLQLIWDDPGLTNCIVNDFDVNPQTGYANDFRVEGNGKQGKVRDENDCEFAYEVNYRIYARNRDTGKMADSDPVIRNGGRE